MPEQTPWKSWHCQKGGGLTHAKIFWWICRCIPKTLLRHHSTQIMIIYPPNSDHLSPKINHRQQLVNITQKVIIHSQKLSFTHFFASRIYALLSASNKRILWPTMPKYQSGWLGQLGCSGIHRKGVSGCHHRCQDVSLGTYLPYILKLVSSEKWAW